MDVISFAASLPAFLGITFGSFWLIAWILDNKRIVRNIWLGVTAQILFVVAMRLVLLALYGAKRAAVKFPMEFGMIGTLAYFLCPLAVGTLGILLVRGATTNRASQACIGTVSGLFAFGLATLHQLSLHA